MIYFYYILFFNITFVTEELQIIINIIIFLNLLIVNKLN